MRKSPLSANATPFKMPAESSPKTQHIHHSHPRILLIVDDMIHKHDLVRASQEISLICGRVLLDFYIIVKSKHKKIKTTYYYTPVVIDGKDSLAKHERVVENCTIQYELQYCTTSNDPLLSNINTVMFIMQDDVAAAITANSKVRFGGKFANIPTMISYMYGINYPEIKIYVRKRKNYYRQFIQGINLLYEPGMYLNELFTKMHAVSLVMSVDELKYTMRMHAIEHETRLRFNIWTYEIEQLPSIITCHRWLVYRPCKKIGPGKYCTAHAQSLPEDVFI